MMPQAHRLVPGALLLLLGCGSPTSAPSVPDHPDCEAGGPGVHVSEGAVGGAGCGDVGAPCASPSEALSALRLAGGGGTICLAAGEWTGVGLALSGPFTGGIDDNTTIVGMGSVAEGGSVLVGGAGAAVIDIAGEVSNVTVRDLRLVGGYRGLVVRESAGSAGPVLVDDVTVASAIRIGVLVSGGGTAATLTGLLVDAPLQDAGEFGWGIAVQQGLPGLTEGPLVELSDVTISQATGVGLLIDASHVNVDDLTVTDTQDDAGELGRGVQSQVFSYGTLTGVSVQGAADAGLFIDRPGRSASAALAIDAITLSGLTGAIDPLSGDLTGDAFVVMQDADEPPDSYFLDIGTVEIIGQPPRASAVFDDVTPGSCNSIFGDGTLYLWQGLDLGDAPPNCPNFAEQSPPLELNRYLAPAG